MLVFVLLERICQFELTGITVRVSRVIGTEVVYVYEVTLLLGPKVNETTEVITVTLESGGVGFGFVPVPVGTEMGVIPAEEVSTGFSAGASPIVLVGVG